MITEDYVSSEIAKLLKEKGFDEGCIYVYRRDGSEDIWNADKEDIACQKPTLQMAVKWLREEHNLAITTLFTVDGWRSYVSRIRTNIYGFVVDSIDGIDEGNIPNCDTWEEAREAAIKYCLENLMETESNLSYEDLCEKYEKEDEY